MTVVTSTDRPQSVRNRCVIEVFDAVFLLSLAFHFLMVLGQIINYFPRFQWQNVFNTKKYKR